MRINAVFSKKVSTAQYENETFTVTVEAESEFNHVEQIADFLFAQARAAVQRQIDGTASGQTPCTQIPHSESGAPGRKPRSANNGQGFRATDKQLDMISKLLKEAFATDAQAREWLTRHCPGQSVTELPRKDASRLIEKLLDLARKAV
jgi:hypothetical protein